MVTLRLARLGSEPTIRRANLYAACMLQAESAGFRPNSAVCASVRDRGVAGSNPVAPTILQFFSVTPAFSGSRAASSRRRFVGQPFSWRWRGHRHAARLRAEVRRAIPLIASAPQTLLM